MKRCLLILLCTGYMLSSIAQEATYPGMVELSVSPTKVVYTYEQGDTIITILGLDVTNNFINDMQVLPDTATFSFYTFSKDPFPGLRLQFIPTSSTFPFRPAMLNEGDKNWFQPALFQEWPGDYSIYLTCISKKGKWLEVEINETSGKTMWMKSGKKVFFHPWEHADGWDMMVTPREAFADSLTIYSKPKFSAKPIVYNGPQSFEVIKTKGDWMQISRHRLDGFEHIKDQTLSSGWIRYKRGSELLVQMCFE